MTTLWFNIDNEIPAPLNRYAVSGIKLCGNAHASERQHKVVCHLRCTDLFTHGVQMLRNWRPISLERVHTASFVES